MNAATSSSNKTSRTRSVLSNWAGFVFAAGVNFALSPFIVHSLGDAAYGIWTLLGALIGYLGLLDLGVRGAVTRYVAKYHTEGNHVESSKIASSAILVFFMMGTLAALAACLTAVYVPTLFNIPDNLVTDARIVIVLGGAGMAMSLIGGVFSGIVVGLQRFDYINAAEIVVGIVRATAIVIALRADTGLVGLAVIQFGISAIRALVSLWLSRKVYRGLRVALTLADRQNMSLIFSFSAASLLLQASGMLILYSDAVVIGIYMPLGMVTMFAIAGNLIEYARAPISGISHTLSPWASSTEAGGELDYLKDGFVSAARIATLVILPMTLTFILRGESFIGLWMGPKYASLSGQVLCILSLGLSFAVATQTMTSTMMGISKHGKLVPAFIIEAICNITISIALIPSLGIVGVAWGTAIPRLLMSCVFAPWYVKRILGVPISEYWTAIWIRPAVAMVPFAIASYFIEETYPARNLLVFFGQIALILPLVGIGAWFLCITKAERELLFSKIRMSR